MKEESFVSDYFPEPPTPTRRQFPDGVLIIRVIRRRCFKASSKITKFIYLD